MRTRDELEAALDAARWKLIDGPRQTSGGWKATIQRGTASKLATGSTEIGVLEDLLRSVQVRAAR
jgi:hypothetical protein